MKKILLTLFVLTISISADTITTQNAVVKVFASIQ